MLYFFFTLFPFSFFFLVVRRRKELNSWKSAGLAVRGHNTTQTSMSDGRKWWHDVQWRGVFSAVNNKSRRWQWTMARLILRAYSRRAHSSLSTQQQQEPPPPVYIYIIDIVVRVRTLAIHRHASVQSLPSNAYHSFLLFLLSLTITRYTRFHPQHPLFISFFSFSLSLSLRCLAQRNKWICSTVAIGNR